ncbi:MAG: hypothetical protein IT258_15055 [Saprospiraceae bacterium]|nr:hypothetical protein [Saprospiraceae bacterium]
MKYLLGPELLWLLFYGMAKLIAKANMPPSKRMDSFIESTWFWVPVVCILLSFVLWWLPAVERRWLLPRAWVAGILGGHFVLETIMAAHSTQGPGIGMGYLVGMILVFCLLVAGSVVVLIKF